MFSRFHKDDNTEPNYGNILQVQNNRQRQSTTRYPVYHSSNPPNEPRNEFTLSDVNEIRILGEGAFGKVVLVRHYQNQQLYAIKVMKKIKLTKPEHIERINTERQILYSADSLFIPKLYGSFQSNDKLYLILEYCPGGELFFHLSQFQNFSEQVVSFVAAEILLALEAVHQQDCIYRDLKPENVLFDARGHVKLCDFGLARCGIKSFSCGTYSMCGTPEYMAPEMIIRIGYGFSVDFWALGIAIFEILTGSPPWTGTNHLELLTKIKKDQVIFPSKVSPNASLLISALLVKNIDSRLGANGTQEVKNHVFFSNINWRALTSQTVPSPFNPCDGKNQSSKDDEINLDNFDTQFTRLPLHSDGEKKSETDHLQAETPLSSPLNHNNYPGFKVIQSNQIGKRNIDVQPQLQSRSKNTFV